MNVVAWPAGCGAAVNDAFGACDGASARPALPNPGTAWLARSVSAAFAPTNQSPTFAPWPRYSVLPFGATVASLVAMLLRYGAAGASGVSAPAAPIAKRSMRPVGVVPPLVGAHKNCPAGEIGATLVAAVSAGEATIDPATSAPDASIEKCAMPVSFWLLAA